MAIDSVLMVNLLLAGPGFNPVHCVCWKEALKVQTNIYHNWETSYN